MHQYDTQRKKSDCQSNKNNVHHSALLIRRATLAPMVSALPAKYSQCSGRFDVMDSKQCDVKNPQKITPLVTKMRIWTAALQKIYNKNN